MRPWVTLGLVSCLLSACPLEPLTVTGFGVSSSLIRPGSLGSGSPGAGATVSVSVPGLRGQDAAGLTAMLNGTPVPIVTTRDGEVTFRLPPGFKGDKAQFELWRSGDLLTSRDIAAQLAQGGGVSPGGGSPTDGVTVRTNGETTSTTPIGGGSVTINITVPAGSGTGGGGGTTTLVTTTGSGTGGSGSGTSATPTPSPTPTPAPTPTATATPTPAPTLVPVPDQTPVPPGTGEVTGNVQF